MYIDETAIDGLQIEEPEKEKDMATVKDVVCGMDIDPNTASSHTKYEGETYHFCSSACHDKFIAEPKKFTSALLSTP